MPLLSTRGNASARAFGLSSAVVLPPGPFDIVKPSSVTATGGTATVGSSGVITVSNVQNITLNGIFSSRYKDYVVYCRAGTSDTSVAYFGIQLSASGVAASSGYGGAYMILDASSSPPTWSGGTWTGAMGQWLNAGSLATLFKVELYSPFENTQTVYLTRNAAPAASSAYPIEMSSRGIKNDTSSYDGLYIYKVGTPNLDGDITVYGLGS